MIYLNKTVYGYGEEIYEHCAYIKKLEKPLAVEIVSADVRTGRLEIKFIVESIKIPLDQHGKQVAHISDLEADNGIREINDAINLLPIHLRDHIKWE